ncbi:MAG TPA: hypothetical protein VMU19_13750 [Bryobacteraceae bacterium]|nr:hypothetical protein [Bryobacteraceae bacterium]
MSRTGLKASALVLSLSIIGVLFAGFDDLPRGLRRQIDSEAAALAASRAEVQAAQAKVDQGEQADPALYRDLPAAQQWPAEFAQSSALLDSAGRDLTALQELERQNRRTDRDRVESLLAEERGLRSNGVNSANSVAAEAASWEDRKQRLPQTLTQMQKDREAIHAFDLGPVTAAVRKAESDWPAKKADLDARLAAEQGLVTEADKAWDSTAAARAQAASGSPAGLDYGTLLGAADQVHAASAALPANAAELQGLTGQLYTSWDKVLADMETRGVGSSKEWDQKIETVTTKVADPAGTNATTASEDHWVAVPQSTYRAMQNDLGMAIAHKSLGQYDSEAEKVAQPAGFAYMATPAQGSNQYGYWDHRNGQSFWVFYGQYALLRDLLFRHDYRPIERGDWDSYRDYQTRGQTYYGHDEGGQRYGTQGSATQQRYAGSSYAQGGGFKDSQYASKPGGFGSSRYASPSGGEPGKSFGRNSSPESGHFSPPPRSFHPAPAPRSFHMPSGGGHRFGRH